MPDLILTPTNLSSWLRGEGSDFYEDWFSGMLDDATLCEVANEFNLTRKQLVAALRREEQRQQEEW